MSSSREISVGSYDFTIIYFNSWADYLNKMNEYKPSRSRNVEALSDLNRKAAAAINSGDKKWYGSRLPNSMQELLEKRSFGDMSEYLDTYRIVKRELSKFRKQQNVTLASQRKIAFNDRELGVFSFDRAAGGLRQQIQADGTKKIISDFSKVYGYHEKMKMDKPIVKIYFPYAILSGQKEAELLYKGILTSILVKELQNAHYDTEVHSIEVTTRGNNAVVMDMTVKRNGRNISENDLLLVTSDLSIYRYHGFKGIINTHDMLNRDVPSGLGGTTSRAETLQYLKAMHPKDKIVLIPEIKNKEQIVGEITTIIKQINNEL